MHSDEPADDTTGPLNLNPSKQSPIPAIVPPLDRAWGPHPDFRSEPSNPDEESFRHSSWHQRRKRTWDAFQRVHLPLTRLDRFAECGSGLWVGFDSDSGDIALQCNCCHDRFCVPCSTVDAAILAEQLQIAMEVRRCRFATLTLRHSDTPLKAQLDRLYQSFNRLRERAWWKACVDGGATFLELKLGKKDGLWHVHMHLIVTGTYMDQRQLSLEWHAVTGDSSIVDVRAIPDSKDVARYVTKYVTKPASTEVYEVPDRLDEMIISLRGRRLCTTFGTWRGIKLHGDETPPRKLVNKRNVSALMAYVRKGDAEAYGLWRSMLLKWPSLAHFDPASARDILGPGP